MAFERTESEFLTGSPGRSRTKTAERCCRRAAAKPSRHIAVTLFLPQKLFTRTLHAERTPAIDIYSPGVPARGFDINWPPHPTKDEVRLKYETDLAETQGLARSRALTDLPQMTDREMRRATLNMLALMLRPTDTVHRLSILFRVLARLAWQKSASTMGTGVTCLTARLCFVLAFIARPALRRLQAGFRFGQTRPMTW